MSIMADKLAVQVPLNSKTLLIISKIRFFTIFKKKGNDKIFLLELLLAAGIVRLKKYGRQFPFHIFVDFHRQPS